MSVHLSAALSALPGYTAFAAYAVFAAASVRLARVDLRERRLPNGSIAWSTGIVGGLLALAAAFGHEWDRFGRSMLVAVVYGAALLALWAAGRGALGAGDVKLAPLLGMVAAWAGCWTAALWAPLSIAVSGAAAGSVTLLRGREEFAFGPPMIAGTWIGIALGLTLG